MNYKQPKLIGSDEDGLYLGRIEMIGTGRPYKVFGLKSKDYGDTLYISNRHSPAWIFSLFTGYRQIGTFKVAFPNEFREGQDVIVEKKDNKIVDVHT